MSNGQFDKREYFKLQESEMIFGVQAETVRKWIKRDPLGSIPPLPAFKPGKDILIKIKDMQNYIKQFPMSA